MIIKIIANSLRYLIALPLEAVRYPLIFCLRISMLFFAVGSLILLAFGYSYSDPILYEKSFFFASISAISGGSITFYLFLLKIINPFYGWLEKKEERKYFNKEYRLDRYKNNKRFSETGFDKFASEQDIYHMIHQIYINQKQH